LKVRDLNNQWVHWKISGSVITTVKSQYHELARLLLKQTYPTTPILEEVSIPVRQFQTLYLDFYIPLHQMAIEVHGEQHFTYIRHFHGNYMGYLKQKTRDNNKIEWCKLNNINLVVLKYNEDKDEWLRKIK